MRQQMFFDTSSIVKLYHHEDGSDESLSIINLYNPIIVISDLTKIEFVSAFAKKVRTKEIDMDIFQEIIKSFEIDTEKFEVIEIEDKIKKKAIELLKAVSVKRGLKTLDAFQLASALTFSKISKLDLFIVCDKILGTIAEDQGLKTLIV